MARYIEGENRQQTQLLPDCLEDYVSEDNPVRVVDVFIDELDLGTMGFAGPGATGRPGYHPAPFSSCTSTATSTRFSRAAGSSARPAATSR